VTYLFSNLLERRNTALSESQNMPVLKEIVDDLFHLAELVESRNPWLRLRGALVWFGIVLLSFVITRIVILLTVP
jgi:hypothetical protein